MNKELLVDREFPGSFEVSLDPVKYSEVEVSHLLANDELSDVTASFSVLPNTWSSVVSALFVGATVVGLPVEKLDVSELFRSTFSVVEERGTEVKLRSVFGVVDLALGYISLVEELFQVVSPVVFGNVVLVAVVLE